MKDYLLQLIRSQSERNRTEGASSSYAARNLAREYLQARILEGLQRAGAMIPLAFQGGTALRFFYNIARFSEDLDFALEQPTSDYDFPGYLRAIQSQFASEGYRLQIKMNDKKIVQSAFFRFYGLPYELGISAQPNEALSIKVEVDTRPPSGAVLETDLIRRYVTLRIQHHDRASLMAGKLHAILSREYAKGRDWYDLMWYLSDPLWPEPNLNLLKNALAQTGWQGPEPGPQNWRGLVYEKLRQVDWKTILADVRPFLERPEEAELLTRENLTRLLMKGDEDRWIGAQGPG